MKKKLCGMAAAVLMFSGAAFADIAVEGIVVNQAAPTPMGTNIRVNLMNGATPVSFNRVELQARGGANDQWQTIKTWDRQINLGANLRQSFDYLPGGEVAQLDPVLTGSRYELRAVVSGPSGELTSFQHEYVATDDDDVNILTP